MTLIHDKDAEERSIMNRHPCICTGAATGVQCAHYWAVGQKFDAQQPDALNFGDKRRSCNVSPSFMLEFTTTEEPHYCNHYVPRKEPGLVNIIKRAAQALTFRAIGPGYKPFDPRFEKYRPMSADDIEKLRKLFPDKPKENGATFDGKNPAMLSAEEIAKGVQIGIIDPNDKEKLELARAGKLGVQASKETEEALGSIFDRSGATSGIGAMQKNDDEK